MRSSSISAKNLFQDHQLRLNWQWLAGNSTNSDERVFEEVDLRQARSGADLIGYLNYIHPYRVQILGEREIAYLNPQDEENCTRRVKRIVELDPPMLVICDGQKANEILISTCEKYKVPLFHTKESAGLVMDVLRSYLSKHFAQSTSMHGVFMDILGLGVLITGESGLGKSELGLELISRGNGLVADDYVELQQINQTTIQGSCPELLKNLLEVRGIGLLDIKAIFGESAVRRQMRLKLIVHLVKSQTLESDYERLPHEQLYQKVLDVDIPKVIIQVVAGRNIAVIVEAAVRNHILQLRGINTYEKFVQRQKLAMQNGE